MSLVQLQTRPLEPLEFGSSALATQTRGYYIYLTEACNLRCSYCFVDDKHNHRHLHDPIQYARTDSDKEDMVQKFIDFVLNDPNGRSSKYIHFFGGEPLIRAKSIERICREITEQAKTMLPNCKITWGITTNGTLLTDENCQLLKRWNVGVQLSLDGSEEGNDVTRQLMGGDQAAKRIGHNHSDVATTGKKYGAFKLVKIANYLKYFGDNARMTLTIDNLRFLNQSIHELKSMGFKSFSVIPDTDSGSWDGHWEEYRHEVMKLWDTCMQDGTIIVNFVKQTMDTILTNKPAPTHLCQAGRNVIGISVDGDIYPCHDFLGKYSKNAQTAHDLQIGHIDKGWTLNTTKFEDVKCNDEIVSGAGHDCKTCHAKSICERGCPYINYASEGAVKTVNSAYCEVTRINAEIALVMLFKYSSVFQTNLKTKAPEPTSMGDQLGEFAKVYYQHTAPFGRRPDGLPLLPGPAVADQHGWTSLLQGQAGSPMASMNRRVPGLAPREGATLVQSEPAGWDGERGMNSYIPNPGLQFRRVDSLAARS